ncbi:MAG: ribbon-helix-helix domain-containing protein [Promethearchaeota archaeon]
MTQYRTVKLPEDLLNGVRDFIEENNDLGYRSASEFVIDATRRRLEELKFK